MPSLFNHNGFVATHALGHMMCVVDHLYIYVYNIWNPSILAYVFARVKKICEKYNSIKKYLDNLEIICEDG